MALFTWMCIKSSVNWEQEQEKCYMWHANVLCICAAKICILEGIYDGIRRVKDALLSEMITISTHVLWMLDFVAKPLWHNEKKMICCLDELNHSFHCFLSLLCCTNSIKLWFIFKVIEGHWQTVDQNILLSVFKWLLRGLQNLIKWQIISRF